MGKFGKFVFMSAMAGAAAYGAYSFLRKEEVLTPVTDEDDTVEFDEDLDGEPTKARSYINLTFNKDKAEDLAKSAVKKAKETISDSVQKVEEFFNDEAGEEVKEDIANTAEEVTEDVKEAVEETVETIVDEVKDPE